MVALRSRRLETLFGAPFDALTAEHVRSLVPVGAQEAFDLEFKATLYGRTDQAKRDLAGDVAALANTAGGVIVLGIEEDDQARASKVPGVEVTDAERRRMEQVIAGGIAPIPAFDVICLADDTSRGSHAADDPTTPEPGATPVPAPVGFILIAVPRSPGAPHAVLVNDGMRFPKRNGTTIRYLAEPEVAAAYRDRSAGAERQGQRITAIEEEAIARLDLEHSWVLVSLVPDIPGDLMISQSVFKDFQRTFASYRADNIATHVDYYRQSVGRQRLLADDGKPGSTLAATVLAELHADGSGVYARGAVNMAQRQWSDTDEEPPSNQLLSDEAIVVAIIHGVLELAQHARDRAAAGGNAIVRARIVPAASAGAIEIGHTRTFGIPDSRTRMPVSGAAFIAETAVALDDAAQPGRPLVSAAGVLADGIGHAISVPEMGQLSRDGEIRQRYWGSDVWRNVALAWAQQNGIPITDETID